MKLTRRQALKLGLIGSGTILSPFAFPGSAQAECSRDPLPPSPPTIPFSPQVDRFTQPLRRMEALQPSLSKTYEVTVEGRSLQQPINYYDITMRKQTVELIAARDGKPAKTAEFWSYNGIIPGPLFRQAKGRQSCIRFTNELGQDANNKDICTSVHLHGMASLPQYDGHAEDLTPPGYYKDYYYPNNRASILWYHDHAVGKTSRNVYMGLAGMYIVEYAREDFCNPDDFGCLPSGEFEIPLVIQDKTFEIPNKGKSDQWRLVFNDRQQRGVYADMTLVNGVPFPYLAVKRRKYFFRLLNGSASRTYQLTLSRTDNGLTVAGDQIIVVGTDAGLLGEPVPLVAPNQSLRVGVAERYGFVIDFGKLPKDVKQIYLRDVGFSGNLGAGAASVMRFDVQDDLVTDDSYIPPKLGILTLRSELEKRSTQTRSFRFGRGGQQWTINGQTWNPKRVDANPKQCDTEIWTLTNTGGWTHPVHIHLIDFQIIDRNGAPPLPYERGWKDVVVLSDFESARVVARFGPHRGKYMMHCHNIVHEDHDMMTQFEVGTGGPDPILTDPPKASPGPALGSATPPILIEDQLPCKCLEPLPNNCGIKIDPIERCKPT